MTATILTVNVSRELEKKLRVTLAGKHYNWVRTRDGLEAYHACTSIPVDMVLTDRNLPPLTVNDLADGLRQAQGRKDLPVLMVGAPAKVPAQGREEGPAEDGADPVLIAESVRKTLARRSSESAGEEFYEPLSRALAEATTQVFETMVMMQVEPGERKQGGAGEKVADLMGTISLTGLVAGSLTLLMDEEFASILTSQMLCDFSHGKPELEEMTDAVGEVTNMIAGGIKTSLYNKASLFAISLPTVTVGKGVRRVCPAANRCLEQQFKWRDHSFLVEVQVHSLGRLQD